MTTPGWLESAACRGMPTIIFYPRNPAARRQPRFDGPRILERIAEAKAICARCPVRAECLEDAETSGELDGIRGGLLPEERTWRYRTRCVECGDTFTAARRDRQLCSEQCRARRHLRAKREFELRRSEL